MTVSPKYNHYTDCAIPTQTPHTSKVIINFNVFQVFRGLGCSHTERVQKNAHPFLSRPGTCLKYSLPCSGPIFLKYWNFLFECCLSFLAQRVDFSHKLYLAVSPTNNIQTDSYIESRMSACKLSPFCQILLLGQPLIIFLCGP